MRPKQYKPQLATVRPLIPSTGDVFGDVSVTPRRGPPFTIKMQVAYNRRETSIAGAPGRDIGVMAIVLVNKAEAASKGWTPQADDLVELIGDKLFVRDIQPESAQSIRLGRPTGGWDEWRLNLSNSDPMQRAATQYE